MYTVMINVCGAHTSVFIISMLFWLNISKAAWFLVIDLRGINL